MTALTGGYSDPAIQSAAEFRILMQAMAQPGTIRALSQAVLPAPPGRAAGKVPLLLADPTTPHLEAPPTDPKSATGCGFMPVARSGRPPAPLWLSDTGRTCGG